MLRLPLWVGLTAVLAAAPAAAEIARIKQSSGTASVERSSQRLKASPGLQLQAGDRLVTGKDGRMSLTFIDNTRFAVGPNSRISVSDFQYDRTRQKGTFVTQVDRGSLAVVSGKIAKSNRDAMKVRTPNTLARRSRHQIHRRGAGLRLAGIAAASLLLGGCATSSLVLLPDDEGQQGSVAVLEAKGQPTEAVIAAGNSRTKLGDRTPVAKPLGAKGLKKQEAALLTGLPPPARSFILYFDQGTTTLTPQSVAVLTALRAEIAARSGPAVEVIGHTDTVGSEADNDRLSTQRAAGGARLAGIARASTARSCRRPAAASAS